MSTSQKQEINVNLTFQTPLSGNLDPLPNDPLIMIEAVN
jgi:hypothetical protein